MNFVPDDAPTQHLTAPSANVPPQQQSMPVSPAPQGSLPPQQSMPVTAPSTSGPPQPPPPSAPPEGTPPPQQSMPIYPSDTGAAPDQDPTTLGPAQRFELQPSHALWVLTVFAALATLVSSLGWILVVGGCAYGAWYLDQRQARWPADIRDLLARAGLAQPTSAAARHSGTPPTAVIPFRPMSFPEIFTGAFRVVSRQWPTVVGIPMAFLLVAGMLLMGVLYIMLQTVVGSPLIYGSSGLGGFLVVFVVLGLLMYAVALPLDALLIALTVVTSDKAVRGEQIRMADIFTVARQRMFAVLRLTLGFYSIFILTDVLVYVIVVAALLKSALAAGIFFYLLLLAANFAIGILFSLAPIVVITEQRGALDSFKRSVQLVKSVWGRILGIHLLWAVCVIPILLIPALTISFILGSLGMAIFMLVALSFLLAFTRTLQVLVYTDLRMRQENYEHELIADWARNTGVR